VGRKTTDLSDNALVLPDPTISSRHLSISGTPGGEFEVKDLESTNGTVVNGEVVLAPVKVQDGAIIFAGSHVMVFRTASRGQMEAIDMELAVPLGPVATVNPTFAVACQRMRLLATTREDVLLFGETGTGKEIYARAIHRASARRGEFVTLDCAATPPALVDAVLFGAPGKRGLVDQAEGGTLYLDEIAEMDARALAKLLRLTEQDPLTSGWSVQSRAIDVRIIASSSRAGESADSTALRPELAARFGTEPV
jgi:transcriptional regulator with PAS, ATPase and Fis domain